ncbi:hypothetical protein [Lactovum miscens]|uniref:Uncharacterized protein n=1 Tax=Lactovum miscens TaxID=190387 RepID=A0A841C5K5_9LACT|nr:hypothetical protein [Lactovum miscens]MBB5887725.1 hypothetical protein [Lactovum miscens]
MNYQKYKEIISTHNNYAQPIICLIHLTAHEKTSAYELRELYGFLDPAKQISILKTAYGIKIYKHNIQVVNRFGRKVHTKEYSLEQLDGFTEDING